MTSGLPTPPAILALAVSVLACSPPHPQGPQRVQASQAPDATVESATTRPVALDAFLDSVYGPAEPGAAVLVQRGGEVLMRDAYGMADLELGVQMAPEYVFHIGSITKQFTAAAILMLVDEGQLSLTDPITALLPTYPVGEFEPTVEHLLHHTAGVHNYTDFIGRDALLRESYDPDALIALFSDQPLGFTPGEDWNYSNSGYVLLGRIIEVASGQDYAGFIRDRILAPAGMTSSYYGSATQVIPNRVEGYVHAGDGWHNNEHIGISSAYSDGALLSTVGDLARWYRALDEGKLVDRDLLQRAYSPARLPDGRNTRYGYGWRIGEVAGRPTLEHGGAVDGFRAYALRVPTEELLVLVLSNRVDDGPSPVDVSVRLAELVLGSTGEPPVVALSSDELGAFVGVYRIDNVERRVVTLEDGTLYSQRTDQEKLALAPIGDNEFLFPTGTRAEFVRGEDGRVVRMIMRPRAHPDTEAIRMDDGPDAAEAAVVLPREVLERYTGAYQFGPGAVLTIRLHEGALQAEVRGLPPVMLEAESPTAFRAPRVPAWLEFQLVEDGTAEAVVVLMRGERTLAPRIQEQEDA